MLFHRCATLMLVLGLSACASSASSGEETTAPRDARGSRTLITRAQLQERGGDTAYQAIERLHRNWLQQNRRGAASLGESTFARVVVDGNPRGQRDGFRELELMSANDIESIRYFSASAATIKWGTGYMGGAIEVTMRGNLR